MMKLNSEKLKLAFSFPPATKTIALICVAVFIVEIISGYLIPIPELPIPLAPFLQYSFGLYLPTLLQGAFWQPLTYGFMHGSWIHLGLNLFTLLFFGSAVERLTGTKYYWKLFLLSSIIGGLGWMLCDYFEPYFWNWIQGFPYGIFQRLAQNWGEHQIPGQPYNICIGASAGVFGLIGAFTALCPRQRLTIFLLYVFPVKMQARYMALLLMFITLFDLILSTGHVAHAAHLFGGIVGYLLVKRTLWRTKQTLKRDRP